MNLTLIWCYFRLKTICYCWFFCLIFLCSVYMPVFVSVYVFLCRKLKSRKMDSIDDARFNVQDYVNEHSTKGPTCPPCNLWVNYFNGRSTPLLITPNHFIILNNIKGKNLQVIFNFVQNFFFLLFVLVFVAKFNVDC